MADEGAGCKRKRAEDREEEEERAEGKEDEEDKEESVTERAQETYGEKVAREMRESAAAAERAAKAKEERAETIKRLLDEIAELENEDGWLDRGQTCGTCWAEFWPSETGYEGVGQCSLCNDGICSNCFYHSLVTRKCCLRHRRRSDCVHDDEDLEGRPVFDQDATEVDLGEDECRRGIVCPKCVYKDVKANLDGHVENQVFLRAKYTCPVEALREEGYL